MDGVDRVNSILAVARSIGDKYLKDYVICKPDCYCFDMKNAIYIIIGCDGLFDEYSSEEVNNMLQQIYNKKITDKNLFQIMSGRKDIN